MVVGLFFILCQRRCGKASG